ncbi:maleylacetoacetate isomerase [Tabrizicola sp. TH137]|uniref:maleylacetoacetate isomerase n=1 Tax=Tabrizicola sp. TH137 TaxID=2067452 RepID=UPI000C7C71AA|nr:maleylacetoacetate isomerase [Tabrizicola sp. TH137]PLL10491.1 maleylacetoacetate isomerase [Tabrizicola sp. TH137]
MEETVLFDYWRSSAAYRVRIALNLLHLPYRTVSVDLLAGDQIGPENLVRNPQGLVPTIEIDGLRMTQSLAILEYLNDTRRAGWLPADPAGRAVVRALAYAVAVDLHPVCNLRVARHAVSLGATMEGWMQHFITLGLNGLEGLLHRNPAGQFCYGDSVTLADICLVPQIYNAHRWAVDLSAFPRVSAIFAVLEELLPFQMAHPDRVKPAG